VEPRNPTPRLRIAVLAPMPNELRPFARTLGLVRSDAGGLALHRGTAGGTEVVASLTGIGMRAGAEAAERVLDAVAPDHVVVVGVAGGVGASVRIGDLVVPAVVENRDTGQRFRPAVLGAHTPDGTLACSDAFLTSLEEARRLAARGVVAVDMETAAIAGVCERRGCPWSVFRGISDRADDGSADPAVLGLVTPAGRPRPGAVIRYVLRRPARVAHLARLARGADRATRAAAAAAAAAIASRGRDRGSTS